MHVTGQRSHFIGTYSSRQAMRLPQQNNHPVTAWAL